MLSPVSRAAFAVLSRAMASVLVRTCLAACTLLGAACSPPPAVSPAELAYPVLVLFPQSGSVRHDDAADLRVMSVQRVMGANGPVVLIDSRLDIYRLDRLESTHSGLWLMAHPNGQTDVDFELQCIDQADIEQARRLMLEREPRLRGAAATALRAALSQASTLEAMLRLAGKQGRPAAAPVAEPALPKDG
jgi:hypothetical protein